MHEFNYHLNFDALDFREHPELYRVGRGEQGVLFVEPYKSEILPHWRFATPEIARASSQAIYALFLDYLAKNDFVGADMARKQLPQQSQDLQNAQIKAEAAQIFKQTWDECRANPDYKILKKQFEAKYVNDRQYDNLPKAFLREHPFL